MITALRNLQLISGGCIAREKAVLIAGDKIIDVVNEGAIPENAKPIDLHNAFLAPGLIDLQIYGSGTPLFFGGDPSAEALAQMEHASLREGTTGFFAAIATNTNAIVEQGIAAAVQYQERKIGNLLGLHLEGPYLNAKRKGAHPEKYIKKASLAEVKCWVEKADGTIKMMTIAPELQSSEVISYLYEQGIILSAGHSDATYSEGKSFLNKPIPAVTHLYNAMPQMHHRQPGYIPAIFEEKPYTSIVVDGVHVDFAMVRLAKRELGDKLFLITDAVTETDKGLYQHQLKGDRYVTPDGTLSGSFLTLLKAVENCVKHAGIELAEAINMASLYPALLIGAANNGKIEAGYNADMVIFNDAFKVMGTIFKGNLTKRT